MKQGPDQLYRELLEYSGDVVYSADNRGVFTCLGGSIGILAGYEPEELLGRPISDCIIDEDRPLLADVLAGYASGIDVSREIEVRFLVKSGEIKWTRLSLRPIRDAEGFKEIRGSISDATESRQAREALGESEERYRLLCENVGDSVFSVDENGTILLLNRRAAEYLGGNQESLIGKSLLDVIPCDAAENRMSLANQAIRQKSLVVREEVMVLHGSKRWFQTSLYPVHGRRSGMTTVQIVSRDITREKERSMRAAARIKLLAKLRNSDNIGECLRFGCEAVVESTPFSRVGIALAGEPDNHPESFHISLSGRLEEYLNALASGQSFPDDNPPDSTKIGRSYVVGHSGGVAEGNDDSILMCPMLGEEGKPIGWVCAAETFYRDSGLGERVAEVEELVDIITQHIREIRGRLRLKEERQALAHANVALTEVMTSIEEEKEELRGRITENLNKVIIPMLEKIDNQGMINRPYYEQLTTSLKDLASAPGEIRSSVSGLTSREMQICELVRSGLSNRQIARKLGVADGTIKKHREAIRRKLGLRHREINLTTFLLNK